MKLSHIPSLLVASALVALPLVSVASVAPAMAENLGTLKISPSSGGPDAVIDVTTSGPCPAGKDAAQMIIYGAGFPKTGQNMTSVSQPKSVNTHPFVVQGEATLADIAAYSYPPTTYKGTYTIAVQCRTEIDATSTQFFVGAITWSSPFKWTVAKSAPVKAPVVAPIDKGVPHPHPTKKPVKKPTTQPSAKPTSSPTPSPSASATPTVTASPSATATPSGQAAAPSGGSSGTSPLLAAFGGLLAGVVIVGGFVLLRNRGKTT